MANREQRKADVLQGTLDLMVLQTLETLGPLHGYAIAARLEQVSSGAVRLNMGTLYPGLMRLEQRGHVRGEWMSPKTTARRAIHHRRRTAATRQTESRWDRTVTVCTRSFVRRPVLDPWQRCASG
jgi:hypothetical protein